MPLLGALSMGKSSGRAPAPPDPYATSAAQTQSNRDTAAYNAAIDRVNTYTPLGSQEYTQTGTDPTTGAPIYRNDIRLSPDQQALFDQQTGQNRQIGDIAGGMMNQVQGAYGQPMDTSGLPGLQGPPQMGGYQGQLNINGPGLQGTLDTNGMPKLYGDGDLQQMQQSAQDALYDRNTAYLDRDVARSGDSLRSRLANQGVVEGSEAYRNAMDDENRKTEMAYRQARNDSIAGAGTEASRLFGLSSQARGQTFGERQATGQFQNDARGQAMAEGIAGGSFANAATGAQNQDALAAAGFGNQARAQGMNEQFALRNQPLNEFNSLRSASPVSMPEFQGPGQVGSANTDVAGNIWNAYNGQLNNYNAQQAGNNNFLSGLFGLGAAAITKSDRRAKKDIKRIGELPSGVGMFRFKYKGSDVPKVGAMAQDVEKIQPDAVTTRKGVKHVNYSKVMSKALRAA